MGRQVHYTVFIRLPFIRDVFVEPQPVDWDAVKDKALWKIISKASNSRDLDWEEIAARFDVSLDFMMQQAAWLYERHFAGVRKQMQRLVGTGTPSTSSTTRPAEAGDGGSGGIGGASALGGNLQRKESQGGSQAPSAMNVRKDSSLPPNDSGSNLDTPKIGAPPLSRTPSTTTITQSRLATTAVRAPARRPLRSSGGSYKRPTTPRQQPAELAHDEGEATDDASELPRHASDSEEEDLSSLARSQAFRRAPLSRKPVLGELSSDGDGEDYDDMDEDADASSSGGYLPFATGAKAGKDDPNATLRGSPKKNLSALQPAASAKGKSKQEPTSSSASSASSGQPPPSSDSKSRSLPTSQRPGALSPKHRAQLAQQSARHRQREGGSDGTPSMGSSFSDLDDAGISGSAIEDAVLSNMQAGGGSIASRVSGLSQAFRGSR